MKNRLENQLDISPKTPMVEIVEIDFDLVGPKDGVVVGFGVGLLGEKFLLVAIFDACGACDARAELQDPAVVALQLVGIAGHVGTRADETHLPDEDVDQFGEAVHLAVAQPMSHARDARVVGRRDGVALSLMVHGPKLADAERLAIPADAPLHEKDRPFRVDLDEDGNDKQRQKKHKKTYECHDAVEAPLEEEPYPVTIFLHG